MSRPKGSYRSARRELARRVTKEAKTKPSFAAVWSQLRLSGRKHKRPLGA